MPMEKNGLGPTLYHVFPFLPDIGLVSVLYSLNYQFQRCMYLCGGFDAQQTSIP